MPLRRDRVPTAPWPAAERRAGAKRLLLLLALLPLLVFLCGWAGAAAKVRTSRMHATVRLAERVYIEEAGKVQGTTDPSSAFRATGKEIEQLYSDASAIRERFGLGGWFVGGFIGLVAGLKLIGVSLWRRRTDYEADRAGCLACGRCFEYCPREHARLRKSREMVGRS